eukprot:gene12355-6023_t
MFEHNTSTINVIQPSNNKNYTIPDVGANSNFIIFIWDWKYYNEYRAFLETNDIVSKTGSDITIDAAGDQRINFVTLSNFGTRFTTTSSNSWAAEFKNNTGNYKVVTGTYETAGENGIANSDKFSDV